MYGRSPRSVTSPLRVAPAHFTSVASCVMIPCVGFGSDGVSNDRITPQNGATRLPAQAWK